MVTVVLDLAKKPPLTWESSVRGLLQSMLALEASMFLLLSDRTRMPSLHIIDAF